jgi:hypothetical protein
MMTPLSRFAAAAASALLLLPAPPAARAAETAEAVEKDLASVFRRMDAMKAELDRIEELAAAPKATLLRVEIAADNSAPAPPVKARFLVEGRLEDEREWSRVERDSFADRHVPMPLVFVIPWLPGSYPARLEVQNPSWKTAPSIEFQAALRKGETTVLRLRLGAPGGQGDPALVRAPDPPAPKPAPPAGKAEGK